MKSKNQNLPLLVYNFSGHLKADLEPTWDWLRCSFQWPLILCEISIPWNWQNEELDPDCWSLPLTSPLCVHLGVFSGQVLSSGSSPHSLIGLSTARIGTNCFSPSSFPTIVRGKTFCSVNRGRNIIHPHYRFNLDPPKAHFWGLYLSRMALHSSATFLIRTAEGTVKLEN